MVFERCAPVIVLGKHYSLCCTWGQIRWLQWSLLALESISAILLLQGWTLEHFIAGHYQFCRVLLAVKLETFNPSLCCPLGWFVMTKSNDAVQRQVHISLYLLNLPNHKIGTERNPNAICFSFIDSRTRRDHWSLRYFWRALSTLSIAMYPMSAFGL